MDACVQIRTLRSKNAVRRMTLTFVIRLYLVAKCAADVHVHVRASASEDHKNHEVSHSVGLTHAVSELSDASLLRITASSHSASFPVQLQLLEQKDDRNCNLGRFENTARCDDWLMKSGRNNKAPQCQRPHMSSSKAAFASLDVDHGSIHVRLDYERLLHEQDTVSSERYAGSHLGASSVRPVSLSSPLVIGLGHVLAILSIVGSFGFSLLLFMAVFAEGTVLMRSCRLGHAPDAAYVQAVFRGANLRSVSTD